MVVVTAKPISARTDALDGIWINITESDWVSDPHYKLSVVSANTKGDRGSVKLVHGSPNGLKYYPGRGFYYLSAGESATEKFTYTISDGHGDVSTSTVTVTVTGVNQNPVTKTTVASTYANQSISVNVLANVTDVNAHDVLRLASLDLAGAQGKATIGSDGRVNYTPGGALLYMAPGQKATDFFTYTVTDGHGGSSVGRVYVEVTGTWKRPVANPDSATVKSTGSVTIDVLSNDTDPQSGVKLSVSSVGLAKTNGNVVINQDGTVTYTPGAAYQGLAGGSESADSFQYTITDGHGYTSTATVSVTVDAPASPGSATPTPAFYVATDGNDSWSGRLAQPNASHTDGPLATFAQAQYNMETSSISTTYIEGGQYYMTTPLYLGSADSGQSWLAMPGETPYLHGGQQVTGWTYQGNGIWNAQAPAGAFPDGGAIGDLFVNGQRMIHARYPNYAPSDPIHGGWLFAAASLPGQDTTNSFQFNSGDIPYFGSTSGLYVDIYPQNGWYNYVLPVSSIDYQSDTIKIAGSTSFSLGQGSRYYLFNAGSQLNAPNEWYYDSATNTISLYAPSGFDGSGATVGELPKIIGIGGASNVTVAGLTLAETISNGYGFSVSGSSNIDLAGNTILNVGTGINVLNGSNNVTIQGGQISQTDINGVNVLPGTSHIDVLGNYIHDIGQLEAGSGISFRSTSYDTFANNKVTNTTYSGISGGSTTGSTAGSYYDNINYNEVGNTNLATSDGGGIYITGVQQDLTGDTIMGNDVFNTSAAGTGPSGFIPADQLVSYGIYLDDYTSGATVYGNLVRDGIGGIVVHAGWDNTVQNNYVIDNSGVALKANPTDWMGPGSQPSAGNVFVHNLVAEDSTSALAVQNLGGTSMATWTDNFYDSSGLGNSAFEYTRGLKPLFENLSAWEALGYDAGSKSGNPLFANPAAGDFWIPANSPAHEMGIYNLATQDLGLSAFQATNAYDMYGQPG